MQVKMQKIIEIYSGILCIFHGIEESEERHKYSRKAEVPYHLYTLYRLEPKSI